MSLTIKQAIEADDKLVVEVPVPEWSNGTPEVVCLRACASHEWDKHEALMYYADQNKDADMVANFRAKLVAKCWCDEKGNRDVASPEDIARLGLKSPAVMQRLYERAKQICSTEGIAEAEKN